MLYFINAKVHYLWLSKGTVRSSWSELQYKMHFYHMHSVAMLQESGKLESIFIATQQITKLIKTHILTLFLDI